jgi:MFS family permease
LSSKKIQTQEFLGLSTFQFLAFFRRLIVYGFLAIYLRSLGLSNIETTLMATVGMIVNASGQSFVWGRLLDKTKAPKSFIVVGEFFAGVGHLLVVVFYQAFLTSNKILAGYIIIFSLGFIELFWSLSNVGWSALIANMTDEGERKQVMARLSVVGGIGGIVGAQTGGYLYRDGLGFDNGIIFYIAAVIMIISVIFVYLLVKPRTIEEKSELFSKDKSLNKFSNLPSSVRSTYILFIVALMIINFGRNSIYILTNIYLSDSSGFGVGGEEIGVYNSFISIAEIIAGLIIGTVIAKVNDNKVMLTGTIFSFLGILWLVIAPNFMLVLITGFLMGSSDVIIESSSYSIISKIIPEEFRGRLFGIFNATFFLSWGIAATFITGPTADYMISIGFSNADAYKISFLVALLIVSIGIFTLLFSFRHINNLLDSHSDLKVEN